MRRSGLFLIELIIVILFFAMTSAICMHIFATAKITADRAQKLDTAVKAAQNAAELYKDCAGDLDATAKRLGATIDSDSAVLALDDELTLMLIPDTLKSDESASFCDVSVINTDGKTVFAISAAAVNS